jgi:DNA primase
MFPIRDVHGSIVGFTARLLKEDPNRPAGKYVNTPQTMVYDKSAVIYGLDRAKQEIKKLGATIVVEGNMDVISCHQAGFKNIVASSGTALTEKQVQLLKRYSPNIIMSFDMDAAGQEAAKRGIEIAWQQEMNIKVLTLPAEFKDPDECIKNDPQIFKSAITNSQNIMDYYFASAVKDKDIKKVEDKKIIASTLLPLIAKIAESIEQTHYLQKLSNLINVSEDVLREKIKKNTKSQKNPQTPNNAVNVQESDRYSKLSERIIALSLLHTEDFKYFVDYLEPEYLTNEDIKTLYKKFIQFYNQAGSFSVDKFLENNPDTQRQIDILYLLAEKEFSALDEKEQQKELISSLKILEKNYISNRIKQIEQEIKTAEAQNNKELVDNLLQEFNLLTQKLTQL